MKKIKFDNFLIKKKSFSCCTTVYSDDLQQRNDLLKFEFNKKVNLSNDCIATALCTLCGKEYMQVYIDLEIAKNVYEGLNIFVGGNLEVKKILTERVCEKNEIFVLNYSGGYDSLAAKCLMPQNTKLVSVDWGKGFEREANFFKQFKSYRLKTNLRELGYANATWQFMGIGSILCSDFFKTRYNVFGSILEAAPIHLKGVYNDEKPFEYLDMEVANFVLGLTEVGTAMVVTKYAKKYVQKSLVSLSNERTEKRYRKEVLTKIVSDEFDRNIPMDFSEPPARKVEYGKYFATDFLALYMIKHVGLEVVSRMISDIPQEAVVLAQSLDLTFYERYNTNCINRIPEKYRARYFEKLLGADILPYDENDWKEYDDVKCFLSKYHKTVL